ncbi:hypothetical protein [Moraxella equi]|uniref:Uncharacterized protein n=1 Tax=Moraxella equi TaxID=60442 RepID=A0ABX3NL02_9GAMM|nr:hypothetical protein [Moraxella equi]OPH40076.1 hypothetical protein B5J93_00945 [Moraxella equi]
MILKIPNHGDFLCHTRTCLPFVFAMKNARLKKQGNRPFFKEKLKFDSYSVKQAFIMKNNPTT